MQIKETNSLNFKLEELWCQKIIYYIEEFSHKLNIPVFCKKYARKLVYRLRDYSISFSGKSLKAVAGAILYLSARKNNILLTQDEICAIARITSDILRHRIKDLQKIII